jgi:CII-binding regulator of phage lambda lysogenization HflD
MFFFDENPFRSPPTNENENKNLTRVKVHFDLSILLKKLDRQEAQIRALHAEVKKLQRQNRHYSKPKAKRPMKRYRGFEKRL